MNTTFVTVNGVRLRLLPPAPGVIDGAVEWVSKDAPDGSLEWHDSDNGVKVEGRIKPKPASGGRLTQFQFIGS